MKRETITVNKIFMAVFGLTGATSLVLAFTHGMLHHMLIALVCAIFYLALKGENKRLNEQD